MKIDQYFDLVVCKLDDIPMFHGTPDEVKTWLEENKDDPLLVCACAHVCLGETLTYTSIENYTSS